MAGPDSPETPPAHGSQQATSLTLLDRLRTNDDDAWRTMVKLYGPLVHHWCVRGGVRGADGDDVAQEVFRAAATSLEAFRRDRPGDSFRGWLRGITRNMVLQHFRRGRRHPTAAGGTDAHLRLQPFPVTVMVAKTRTRSKNSMACAAGFGHGPRRIRGTDLASVLDDGRRRPVARRYRRGYRRQRRGGSHGEIACPASA